MQPELKVHRRISAESSDEVEDLKCCEALKTFRIPGCEASNAFGGSRKGNSCVKDCATKKALRRGDSPNEIRYVDFCLQDCPEWICPEFLDHRCCFR
jgi:hypothetical protein